MTNVLLIYEEMIPSVRLCAYEQLQYLNDIKKISLVHTEVRKVTDKMCIEADIVVFVRGATILEEKLAKKFKKKSKFLIYVLDDDILNVPDGLISSAYYQNVKVKNRIKSIIQNCNVMITPSNYLAKKYNQLIERIVITEEPCLNSKFEKNKNDIIKIGFAGSFDRSSDIDAIISDALYEIYEKYGDRVSIEFMGAKPEIVKELNLLYYPYTNDYSTYKETLKRLNWDIGLAPLPDTEFHRCKHYNKYIEYSSAQIIGIYSNVHPYKQIITNRINGLLCNYDRKSWVDAISWSIENPNELRKIRDYNNVIIKEKFRLSSISNRLYQDIQEFSTYKSEPIDTFSLKPIKYISFLGRTFEFIKRYGFRSPIYLLKKIKI